MSAMALRASACVMALFHSAAAQLQVSPSACGGYGAYDTNRDRVVSFDDTAMTTRLFDGVSWQDIPSLLVPYAVGLFAYDATRRRTIAAKAGIATWEWDGTQWLVGPAPYSYVPTSFHHGHMVYHPVRRRVVAWAKQAGYAELRQWDGSNWSSLPASTLTLTPTAFAQYSYHAMAYDRSRGKLLLFGRTEILNTGNLVARLPILWEWDEQTGWVQLSTNGIIGNLTWMWFEEHRGRIFRYDVSTTINTVSILNANNTWSQVPVTFSLGQLMSTAPAYDSKRGRLYMGWQSGGGFFEYVNPSRYDVHAVGCSSPSPPTLSLTKPWTRPWYGETMSVDVGPAPQGTAILVTGLSDQLSGTTPLPIDLAAFGMPGCSLRVAADYLQYGFDPDGTVTFQLAIPMAPSLIGQSLWQQGFTFVPGANPAGMLATHSRRGVIGRSH